MIRSFFVFVAACCFLLSRSQAEGTKQLRPASGNFGYIQINDKARTFATYIATEDERLNIHISSKREKIYFGFGTVLNGSSGSNDVYYRIKNPQGVVVAGPTRIPTSGQGYISTYARAVAGPTKLNAAGYNAIEFNPVDTGDYYIEFNQGHATNVTNPNNNKRVFDTFDITVIDTGTMTAKPGRLWSKNWDLTTNSGTNGFVATLYVYSNDGVVTSVGFNGIQPHAFRVACNSTGCVDNGNPVEDRKSRDGNFTYPSYKIFLNNPDELAYPSGVIGSLTTSLTLTGCAPDYCININTDAPGYVEFVVELNGIPGYQSNSRDLIFARNVGTGMTCIPWDGKDGLGNTINQNVSFQILAEYKFGLTNLPIFDVENFSGGFIVSSIRPLVIKPKLFWDDTRISGGGSNLNGCTSNACHPWPSTNFGDERTINTWWYVNVQRDTIFTVSIPKPAPSISGVIQSCDTSVVQTYSTPLVPGNNYEWKTRKGTLVTNPAVNQVNIRLHYGVDTIIVKETNAQGCFEDTLFVKAYPTPTPLVSGDTSACNVNSIDTYTTPFVAGNTYQWAVTGGVITDGAGTNSIVVRWTTIGTGNVQLKEKNPILCETTVSRVVQIHPKPSTSSITH